MPMKFEELKKQYPKLWEKAQKKFDHFQAQKKFFLGLVQMEKAKEMERKKRAIEKTLTRKRRTRALILFSLWQLERIAQRNSLEYYNFLARERPIKGKEGKREIDYTPYILHTLEDFMKKYSPPEDLASLERIKESYPDLKS